MTPTINKNNHPIIVGVSGRSCSGKSVATEALANVNYETILLKADCYFNNKAISYKGYKSIEHLECQAIDRMINDVRSLKNGQDTIIQVETSWMTQGNIEIKREDLRKRRLIIIDGFLTFAKKELVDLLDYKIFVDISDLNVLYRRMKRNGITPHTLNYTYDVIIPVSKLYEQGQKDEAGVIVDGNQQKEEITRNIALYLKREIGQSETGINVKLPSEAPPWEISPNDLLTDSLWHPIKYDNLPDFVRRDAKKLESGTEIKGNHFAYNKDAKTHTYQLRLRSSCPMFRYYIH